MSLWQTNTLQQISLLIHWVYFSGIHIIFILNEEIWAIKKQRNITVTMNILLSVLMLLLVSNSTVLNNEVPAPSTDKVEIVIEGTDQMRFNLSEIKVKEGETVVLTLKHVGKLPKAAMGHNWVLLAAGTDVAAYATKAIRAKDTEYIPEGDEALAYTSLIGGGEETTVEFVAPAAGEYTFICSFPGHYALMQGKLIVE